MRKSTRVLVIVAASLAIAASALAAHRDVLGVGQLAGRFASSMRAHLHCYPLMMDVGEMLRGHGACEAGEVVPR